jgi:hypothetical protein
MAKDAELHDLIKPCLCGKPIKPGFGKRKRHGIGKTKLGDDRVAYMVICFCCLSSGPEKPTKKDAVVAWNARFAPRTRRAVSA